MKKKLLFITDSAPHNRLGGGNLTALNICKSLSKDYQIYLINIEFDDFKNFNFISEKIFYKKKNLILKKNKSILDKINIFNSKNLFPAIKFNQKIKLIINKFKPDILICYGYHAMSSCYKANFKNKFSLLGDPPYLPSYYKIVSNLKHEFFRKFFYSIFLYLNFIIRNLPQKFMIKNYMKYFKVVGAFANHHALIDLNCNYFPTPLAKQNIINRNYKNKNKLIIVHIGHMRGTVTIDSLYNLVLKIIPKIIQLKPDIKLEVRLIGKYFDELPYKISNKINTSGFYKNYGHIYNLNKVYKDADLLITPNTINLGIRVRLLTALAQGLTIVTHSSNQLGIPELKHKYNCLIGKNTDQLAQACLQVFRNSKIKKQLERNGMKTFENNFTFNKFLKIINNLSKYSH